MKKIRCIFVLLGISVFFISCTERPLCLRPQPRLDIRLVWPENARVKGADIFVYDADGQLFSRLDSPPEGMSVYLPEGIYTLLAANSDAAEVSYEQVEDWRTCAVNAQLQGDGSGLFNQVDHVYTVGLDQIQLERSAASRTVVMSPRDRIRHVAVSIVTEQIPDVSRLILRMDGVVQSVRLFDGADGMDETVTVNSDLSRIYEQAGSRSFEKMEQGDFLYYTASMSVFGWRGDNQVVIEIRYEDGSVEQSRPVNIAPDLDGLPQEGGELWFEIETKRGEKIAVNMLLEDWIVENGSADISAREY